VEPTHRKRRENDKPKEKATKKESGSVTHSRVRDHLSLALEHCARERALLALAAGKGKNVLWEK